METVPESREPRAESLAERPGQLGRGESRERAWPRGPVNSAERREPRGESREVRAERREPRGERREARGPVNSAERREPRGRK